MKAGQHRCLPRASFAACWRLSTPAVRRRRPARSRRMVEGLRGTAPPISSANRSIGLATRQPLMGGPGSGGDRSRPSRIMVLVIASRPSFFSSDQVERVVAFHSTRRRCAGLVGSGICAPSARKPSRWNSTASRIRTRSLHGLPDRNAAEQSGTYAPYGLALLDDNRVFMNSLHQPASEDCSMSPSGFNDGLPTVTPGLPGCTVPMAALRSRRHASAANRDFTDFHRVNPRMQS
jgi:hypothetical protein